MLRYDNFCLLFMGRFWLIIQWNFWNFLICMQCKGIQHSIFWNFAFKMEGRCEILEVDNWKKVSYFMRKWPSWRSYWITRVSHTSYFNHNKRPIKAFVGFCCCLVFSKPKWKNDVFINKCLRVSILYDTFSLLLYFICK